MSSVVIVESPAKAKTIKKYLGKDYTVLASYGHVRDLNPKEGAVDPEHDFAMDYQPIERNAKHVDAIVKALKKADTLYLATDPDREGEAISWHICELLKERKLLKDKNVARVVFYEVTKSAVVQAFKNTRELSTDLINAQQARRALDFLVGFKLSPLLWKKIRRGLSAGRVQSPALRLIVERELEIEKFNAKEYWTIDAELNADKKDFNAKLTHYDDEKLSQFSVTKEKHASEIKSTLEKAANGALTVESVEKKQRKRNPAAPFITSTLQQEGVRKLGFTAKRTMRTAQTLYEGIDIGEGNVGLITYMRTDSVNIAAEALNEIRDFIKTTYGSEQCPDEPRVFKSKSKNAQEAHEAIRPTSVSITPDSIKKHLTAEQYKVYSLIWKRTVASQMIHATIDTVAVDLSASKGNLFRANGSTIANAGFLAVYQEDGDDVKQPEELDSLLPPMKEGDKINLNAINANQHFTEPPPRYSEASLVKTLEEYGIGRPSTYASIISTLLDREYVTLDKKRFMPTDVGRVVNRFLTEYFTAYVDYDFTAKLEDRLDDIARGDTEWIPLMKDFWGPFTKQITTIDETVERKDVTQEKMDEKCPECGKPLSIRLGRSGRFIGCTAYPDCSYTRNLIEDEGEQKAAEEIKGRKCPKCQSDLVIKSGPYGKFIGCSGYPDCRFIEPLEKPKDTGVACPECKKGNIVQRKSRKGKIFFSCDKYPKCKYAIWNEPLDQACPQCKWPILTLKTTKTRGAEKLCPQKECDYIMPYKGESNE